MTLSRQRFCISFCVVLGKKSCIIFPEILFSLTKNIFSDFCLINRLFLFFIKSDLFAWSELLLFSADRRFFKAPPTCAEIMHHERKDKDGKPRELHTSLAAEAINFADVQDDFRITYEKMTNEPSEIIACPYFTTSLYDMDESISCDYSELDSFVIFMCVGGKCHMADNEKNTFTLEAGETVLLPATTQSLDIIPERNVKLLETYV